ncbi:CrcB family protein [Streptomyces cinnamoneus]|uniref:fluoride efflux transporter FluC n=1 Tax=Streptomyces cinnamoneus TaxID=53446 RepID=UPI003422CC44
MPRTPTSRTPATVCAVSLGGGLGAAARYAAARLWPVAPGGFPWTTMTVNIVGCLAMGALTVVLAELWPARPLARPFLATGVLGGFTTFSTYVVDSQHLLGDGRAAAGLACTVLTPLAAVAAAWSGARAVRLLLPGREWARA